MTKHLLWVFGKQQLIPEYSALHPRALSPMIRTEARTRDRSETTERRHLVSPFSHADHHMPCIRVDTFSCALAQAVLGRPHSCGAGVPGVYPGARAEGGAPTKSAGSRRIRAARDGERWWRAMRRFVTDPQSTSWARRVRYAHVAEPLITVA